MKKIKQLKIWKKLTILLSVIIAICTLICASWYLFIFSPYTGFISGFTEVITDFGDIQYEKPIDNFKLEVHKPDFLSNNGFLAVRSGSFSVSLSSNGTYIYPDTPNISLFVWPNIFNNKEYGLMIDFEKEEVVEQAIITFSKNEAGDYIINHDFQDEKTISTYIEYEETIKEMVKIADTTWN